MQVNKKVNLNLVGLDGNAFVIMGAFTRQARKEGWTQEEIDIVLKEAKSGDYDHLLGTISDYCEASSEYDDDEYDEYDDDDDEW